MDDLLAFLAARYMEQRAALLRKRDGHEGPHVDYAGQPFSPDDEEDIGLPGLECYACIAAGEASPYHDVDFGLADVEAKQQILNLIGSPGPMVLRLLALPFATHPDYLEAWRP